MQVRLNDRVYEITEIDLLHLIAYGILVGIIKPDDDQLRYDESIAYKEDDYDQCSTG